VRLRHDRHRDLSPRPLLRSFRNASYRPSTTCLRDSRRADRKADEPDTATDLIQQSRRFSPQIAEAKGEGRAPGTAAKPGQSRRTRLRACSVSVPPVVVQVVKHPYWSRRFADRATDAAFHRASADRPDARAWIAEAPGPAPHPISDDYEDQRWLADGIDQPVQAKGAEWPFLPS
jgi:hypothetical protein